MLVSNFNESYIESMKNNMDDSFFKEKLKKELIEYFDENKIPVKPNTDFEEIFQRMEVYIFDEDIQDTFDYFFLSKKLGIELT